MYRNLSRFLPDLPQCLMIFLLVVAGQYLFVSLLLALSGLLDLDDAGILLFMGSGPGILLTYLLVFVPVLVYLLLKSVQTVRRNPEAPAVPFDSLHTGRLKRPVYVLAVVSAMVAMVLLSDALPQVKVSDAYAEMLGRMVRKGNLPWTILSVSVAAPLVEEFLCRGIVLRGLLQHRSPWAAILLSALIFALMHVDPEQAVPGFLFGIFFGWIYWRSGSLKTVILLHALNNLATVLFAFFYGTEMTDLSDLLGSDVLYVLLLTVSAAVLAGAVYMIERYVPEIKMNHE